MRPRGANTRSRLLCEICREIKKVSTIADANEITLVCGHLRPQILALQPGRVSIESLRTQRGQECFPLRSNRL